MRWIAILIIGAASAGLIAVSVAMNFAFGSSFGRIGVWRVTPTGQHSPLPTSSRWRRPSSSSKSVGNRRWGAAMLGLLVWGTFTLCSIVSAIGFASANRTFAIDTRTVQAALNQSRLISLETDQSELRRLRDRLASPELGRSERTQVASAIQRLETAITASRGKLEDASPVVSTPNPQAYTLAKLTGAGIDKIEIGLILLVALLVEMGGLGPFITRNLAKVPQGAEGSGRVSTEEDIAKTAPRASAASPPLSLEPQRPRLIHSAAAPLPETLDLERFLDRHAHHDGRSALGSSELLARYNRSRPESGLSEISQRRLGDAMRALGHHNKPRLADGRIHYQGLAWREPAMAKVAKSSRPAAAGGARSSHMISIPGASNGRSL